MQPILIYLEFKFQKWGLFGFEKKPNIKSRDESTKVIIYLLSVISYIAYLILLFFYTLYEYKKGY